jgi:hypothetical protein
MTHFNPYRATLKFSCFYLLQMAQLPRRVALLNALRAINGGDNDETDNSSESDSTDTVSTASFEEEADHADDALPEADLQDSDGEVEVVNSDSSDTISESSDEESNNSEENIQNPLQYICPNGIVWQNEIPPPRRLARNIMNIRPGHRIIPLSSLDAFMLFVDEVLLRTALRYTNRRMRAVGKHPFSFREMKAGIAIIIRAGADRDNLSTVESLFHPNDSRPFYSCALSKNRFRQFMRYITFDNKYTRRERQQNDKLAAVREIWQLFTDKLRRFYEPSSSLTVDEQLYGYRGYAPGRAYMPNKPSKYGIKVFWLCDAENGYALDGVLYSGKDNDTRAVGLAKKTVLHLTRHYYATQRNIFVDRYFSSFSLIDELLTNGLTMTGTICAHSRDVPHQIRNVRPREVFSSQFLWNHEKRVVLCSYVPKRNKNVLLISSMHTSNSIADREDKIPQLILDYNQGKGGVDLMDSCIEDFSCKRKTNRYPLIFFFNILDVALLNSFIIYKSHGYADNRKAFIKQVSLSIIILRKWCLTKLHLSFYQGIRSACC